MSQKALILSFIKNLTLDEHMGDVADTIQAMLWRLGMSLEWDDMYDLREKLDGIGVPNWYDMKHSDVCLCYGCKGRIK
jgi:hypothetical protein